MVKKLQALKAKKGFTLVELIVVIAIIGVLAAILIPTLAGVIESSRKRSAESTCQSIQNIAKTYVSTVMSKKGIALDSSNVGTVSVDMDDEDTPTNKTMAKYITDQIPELKSGGHSAIIDIRNGAVVGVQYREGAFVATWTNVNGLEETKKDTTLGDSHSSVSFASITVST